MVGGLIGQDVMPCSGGPAAARGTFMVSMCVEVEVEVEGGGGGGGGGGRESEEWPSRFAAAAGG